MEGMGRKRKNYKILRIVFDSNIFLLVYSRTKMRKVVEVGGVNDMYDKVRSLKFYPGWLVSRGVDFVLDDYMNEYKVHVIAVNNKSEVLLVSSADEGVVYFDYFVPGVGKFAGRYLLLARGGRFRDMVDLRGRVMYDVVNSKIYEVIKRRFDEKVLAGLASDYRMVIVTWNRETGSIRMYEYVNGR